MKKHKRDKATQAYNHGFVIGIRGQSFDACPYVSTLNLRTAWLSGWREGRTQYFLGFTGISTDEKFVQYH